MGKISGMQRKTYRRVRRSQVLNISLVSGNPLLVIFHLFWRK